MCRTGRAASADGRSPFHPHSTASSPGSARKNFWRVVIVEVRPAGEPARTIRMGRTSSRIHLFVRSLQ
jgi:hypothetical protein